MKQKVIRNIIFISSLGVISVLFANQQGNYSDGSCDHLGKLKEDLQNSAPDISKASEGSSIVAAWSKMVTPDASLPGWTTVGDVKVVKSGSNYVLQLHASNQPASAAQLINFQPGSKTIEFDVWVISGRSGGVLEVLLNNQVLQKFKLSDLTSHGSVSLMGNSSFVNQRTTFPPSGNVTFRLAGSAETTVQLDNLTVR